MIRMHWRPIFCGPVGIHLCKDTKLQRLYICMYLVVILGHPVLWQFLMRMHLENIDLSIMQHLRLLRRSLRCFMSCCSVTIMSMFHYNPFEEHQDDWKKWFQNLEKKTWHLYVPQFNSCVSVCPASQLAHLQPCTQWDAMIALPQGESVHLVVPSALLDSVVWEPSNSVVSWAYGHNMNETLFMIEAHKPSRLARHSTLM